MTLTLNAGTVFQSWMRTIIFFSGALLMMMVSLCAAGGTNGPSSGTSLVHAAPSFAGGSDAGKNITLASLRGKPVILLIASSPRDKSFRAQLAELKGTYERLAAQGMIAFAAFTVEGGRIPSNIPFVLVNDPAGTASAYDVQKFAIAVIGIDGNLDCLSTRPLPGYRLIDLVMNNAAMQHLLRR
jgi:hypothetical protein